MFDKVLVANRGAIACRILRTLKRLDIHGIAIYSDADAGSRHVSDACEAVSLGGGPVAQTYLDAARILDIARNCGAQAIHPGYGFLSENADFAERCEAAGIAFLGPTPEQMRRFGLKHRAREIAAQLDVPLLGGSGLLDSLDEALGAASGIGYPLMLKSTAGGGGIGMRICRDESELTTQFAAVRRIADQHFRDAGVYLERYVAQARHVEVQIFGDGRGTVAVLGDRDCSIQRRNQKLIEEAPAPHLADTQRAALHDAARRLGEAVSYRSAGTVEFVVDADSGAFFFLEVNTRLQVEHGVTEQRYGIDLVEWMLRLGAGELADLARLAGTLDPAGHAIQARLYAEDPARDFRPCPGLLSQVRLPPGGDRALRVDSWVSAGVEIPADVDPLLAKLIAWAPTREEAIAALDDALASTALYGVETNLAYLRQILAFAPLAEGRATTHCIAELRYQAQTLEVMSPGTMTTVQDLPGRVGYWSVGIPPSGPMDARSFAAANRAVGNEDGAPGLEITLAGPTLLFNSEATVAVAGAAIPIKIDGLAAEAGRPLRVPAGATLTLGRIADGGARAYLTIRGGLDVPEYLGSCSTFTLGRFGGHAGRALAAGDVLHLRAAAAGPADAAETEIAPPLALDEVHTLRVTVGPHAAPDFITPSFLRAFFDNDWAVHFNSSRTGVRLVGPRPEWAREDGGEAGLHPSNIPDVPYAIGSVDFTGDMPVILGPDGPSLGGFVCPAVVIHDDLWKLGQLKAGDRIRFQAVGDENPVLLDDGDGSGRLCARRAGDRNLLFEFGEPQIDLATRFRVDALMNRLADESIPGVLDVTPGIRSLQLHYTPQQVADHTLIERVRAQWSTLRERTDLRLPSRIVHLPLSWDDPATRLAIEKYSTTVRADAPWCPSNIEFIRRINGLDSADDVKRIVLDAHYLVLGLGDVYLGAPVATPLDPRHRLVTTKYNPARTWTPENAVGIGGAYLCIYGMEGPGGYQFVGRTVQMWDRQGDCDEFHGTPHLLRFFDQIRFHEVSAQELDAIRRDFPCGRHALKIETTELDLAAYARFLAEQTEAIAAFRSRQQAAFEAERAHWAESGAAHYASADDDAADTTTLEHLFEYDLPVYSPVAGQLWKLNVREGHEVRSGDVIAVLESMKMEIEITAPDDGRVRRLMAAPGSALRAGQPIAVLERTPTDTGA